MLFVFGMAIGAALMGLVFWLGQKRITVRWYEWIIGAIGFMTAGWAIRDLFGSMAEHNEAAGRILLRMLGTPAIILLSIAIFLPWRRIGTSKAAAAESYK